MERHRVNHASKVAMSRFAAVGVLVLLVLSLCLAALPVYGADLPSPPTLLSPGSPTKAPGPYLDDLTPKFQWQSSVPDADAHGLYISRYPYGPTHAFYKKEDIAGSSTSFELPVGVLQYGVMYRWTMASHNSSGWSSTNSSYFYFTTGAKGIDVSYAQGEIEKQDWSSVHNDGYSFSFVRASIGQDNEIVKLAPNTIGTVVGGGIKALDPVYSVLNEWWHVNFASISQEGWIKSTDIEKIDPEPDGLEIDDKVRVKQVASLRSTPEIEEGGIDDCFDSYKGNLPKPGSNQSPFYIGLYFFATPNLTLKGEDLIREATGEAKQFLQIAGEYVGAGYLQPALDIEPAEPGTSAKAGVHYYDSDGNIHCQYLSTIATYLGPVETKTRLSLWIKTWMDTVESNKVGVKPILYMLDDNIAYLDGYLDSSIKENHGMWVAQATGTVEEPPETETWDFWQYTIADAGYVPGIETTVDLDVFNGSMLKLDSEFVIRATNSATVTDIPNPDAYTSSQPGYVNFEAFTNGTNLSSGTISGMQFTTTPLNGYSWLVGDFATGLYNGKYPNGEYTSHGTHWAWLGIYQGSGRIDFPKGNASYFSLLVSNYTPVYLDAYGASGNLLATAGPAPRNTGTGHMTELKITRAMADMAYVIVHDEGNYFEIDDVCTNAPGTPNTIRSVVDETYFMQTGEHTSGNFIIDFIAGARQFLHIFVGPFFSDVDLELTRPDGSVVSLNDPGVMYNKTPNSIEVSIENALAGQWQYEIIANQLEPGGENIHIVARQESILVSNAPPVADAGADQVVEQTSLAGADVTLDGSGSSDPDGDALTYTWTWAGGSATGLAPVEVLPAGTTEVTLEVSDGMLSDTDVVSVTVQDTTPPSVAMVSPPSGYALQDGVTFVASATDSGSGVNSVTFSIREADVDNGIPIGFEDLPAVQDPATGNWTLWFDTLQLPDGYYVVLVEATDNAGNATSVTDPYTVPYSIRNWAVLELLPASESNKAGRTMPVKFSLRVAASVDPAQPFVYNEDLAIKIYATSNPGVILQTSVFGTGSRNYRIDTSGEKYITNFQTFRVPMQYTVEIWRTGKNFMVGSFTFKTVK